MAKKKTTKKTPPATKTKKPPKSLPVHCAFTSMESVDALVPHPHNPNTHSDAQITVLAKIIKHQGWRNPIKISARSGFITAGHARLAAAKLLGEEVVPVDRQKYKNEADEWADLIADNKVAELATIDGSKLGDLIVELDQLNFDLDLTGLAPEDIQGYILGPGGDPDAVPDVDVAGEVEGLLDYIVVRFDTDAEAEEGRRGPDGTRFEGRTITWPEAKKLWRNMT